MVFSSTLEGFPHNFLAFILVDFFYRFHRFLFSLLLGFVLNLIHT